MVDLILKLIILKINTEHRYIYCVERTGKTAPKDTLSAITTATSCLQLTVVAIQSTGYMYMYVLVRGGSCGKGKVPVVVEVVVCFGQPQSDSVEVLNIVSSRGNICGPDPLTAYIHPK